MISLGNVRRFMRIAAWAHPHIERWWKRRNFNQTEGERNLRLGNFAEAEQFLLLAIAESKRGNVRKRVSLRLQLSEAQRKQSKLREAASSAQQALEVAGGDRPERARGLDQLALLAQDKGDFAEAQRLLQESLGIEESFKPPHPAILAVRTFRLAQARQGAGDYRGAAPHFERAIKLYEEAFGAEHPETGKRLAEFAVSEYEQMKYPEARKLLQRALDIHEKKPGHDSPEVLEDLIQLGKCMEAMDDHASAEETYERALRLQESTTGKDPRANAEMILSLSKIYIGTGRFPRAEELLPRALPALEKNPDHNLAAALTMLGMLNERRGQLEDAEGLYQRALAEWEACLGNYNAEISQTLDRLASVLEALDRWDESMPIRARSETLKADAAYTAGA